MPAPVPAVRERLLAACAALPGAVLEHPFGEDSSVFKVGGKIFALVMLGTQPGRVNLKVEPGYAAALVAEHGAIAPGWHMDKRHWVTVDLAGPLPGGLIEELLRESYDRVLEGVPVRLRPYRPLDQRDT